MTTRPDYFIFAGQDLRDFDAWIWGGDTYNAPARSIDVIQVPGRNGDLVMDRGNYSNIEHRYTGVIFQRFLENFANLRNFLLSVSGYKRLEDSFHPNEFYLARFSGDLQTSPNSTRTAGGFELLFSRKPQRFLKAGEERKRITGDAVLVNPSPMTARPLLRVYGVGQVTIGGTAFELIANDGYTDIDCDAMTVYKGSENRTASLVLQKEEFPALVAGENEITISDGIEALEIVPRWWML